MPIVGLTGGFGSGKTYVASIFKSLGAQVIDADKLAHEALKKGSAAYKKITAQFGRSILDSKGFIDRKTLGTLVFEDKKYLARLERIVHPYVIKKIEEKIRTNKSRIAVVDAPLICEAGLCGMMDVLIVVKSSKRRQIDRCMKKFNMKKEEVCNRMACQMPLEEKLKRADYVIDNDGSKSRTRIQVKQVWQDLKKGEASWR